MTEETLGADKPAVPIKRKRSDGFFVAMTVAICAIIFITILIIVICTTASGWWIVLGIPFAFIAFMLTVTFCDENS